MDDDIRQAKQMTRANPIQVEPTFRVRLNKDEIFTIGRKRWAREHRTGSMIATGVMIFTVVYAMLTFMQMPGAAGRWMIAGLVVPLIVLMVVAIRDGKAAAKAGQEFLKDVQAGKN